MWRHLIVTFRHNHPINSNRTKEKSFYKSGEVINGFYMNMRSKFTAPGTSIYYYEAHFDISEDVWCKPCAADLIAIYNMISHQHLS